MRWVITRLLARFNGARSAQRRQPADWLARIPPEYEQRAGFGSTPGLMTARLVSLDGREDIAFDRAVLLVGRDIQCDAQIASLRVSRRHCCLSWHRDGVEVRDLGSANGTRINGRRSDSGRLRPGDELSIAHLRYRLVTDRAEIAARALDPRTSMRDALTRPAKNQVDSAAG
jgi:FHA domain